MRIYIYLRYVQFLLETEFADPLVISSSDSFTVLIGIGIKISVPVLPNANG